MLMWRLLKYGIPVLGIMAGAAIFWLSQERLQTSHVRLSESRVSEQENGLLSMQDVVFRGTDQHHRAFTLRGDVMGSAEGNVSKNLFQLQQLSGDILLEDDQGLSFSSDQGFFRRSEKMLSLTSNVKIHLGKNLQFMSSALQIDLSNHQITTQSPVTGAGEFGNLLADGLWMDREQNVIFLNGKTIIHINN